MLSGRSLIRSKAFAAASLFGLLPLAGCETPPSGVPTAADIRGIRPSGTVTMTQVFVSASGIGSGTLTFRGRNYPFTLIGSLNGVGAIATTRRRARSTSSPTSQSFRGPGFRATAISRSRPQGVANSGFRTTTASSCAFPRSSRDYAQQRALRDFHPAGRIAYCGESSGRFRADLPLSVMAGLVPAIHEAPPHCGISESVKKD